MDLESSVMAIINDTHCNYIYTEHIFLNCNTHTCIQSPFWGMVVRNDLGSWWRHQMETLSALLAICAGNSPVPGEFPTQRPVTRSFDVYFDLRPNKCLSKQSWGWWFETLSPSLWRHRNVPSIVCRCTSSKIHVNLVMRSTLISANNLCVLIEGANWCKHYSDVIMGTIASQITSLTIVYSTVYSSVDQRKHQLVTGEFPAQMASNA